MDTEFSGIIRSAVIIGVMTAALTACGTPQKASQTAGRWTEDAGAAATARIRPATKDTADYHATGYASWYGRKHHGRKTASGTRYDMNAMTAAHRTLAFGTRVRVTNLANGRSVVVTINDRGPRSRKRVIDLSRRAAARLGFLRKGVTKVRLETIGAARG